MHNTKKIINIRQFSIFNVILYGAIILAIVLSAPFIFSNYEKNNVNSLLYIDKIIADTAILDSINNSKIVFYDNKDSNVIAINIMFKGGSSLDMQGYKGISALLSNAMLNGAGGLSVEEFNRLLDKNAIRVSIDAKRDHILLSFSTLSDYINPAFDILDMILNEPNLDDIALSLGKTQLLTELNLAKSNPKTLMYETLFKNLYPNNNSYKPILGNPVSIGKITSVQLVNFKKKVMTASNIHIAISGNTSKAVLSKKLKNIIQKLPQGEVDNFNLKIISPNVENKTIVLKNPQVTQADIVMVFKAPIYNTNNYYYANVLNAYLGQVPDSVLFNELRNKKGLVYNIGSYIYKDAMSTFWQISFSTSADKVEEAITLVKQVLKDVYDKKYAFKDVQVAKNWLLIYQLNYFGNNDSIASYLNASQFYNSSIADSNLRYGIISNMQNANLEQLLNSIDMNNILIIKSIP